MLHATDFHHYRQIALRSLPAATRGEVRTQDELPSGLAGGIVYSSRMNVLEDAGGPKPDHRLFLSLFLQEQPVLQAYLMAAVGHQSTADELLQEVSSVLWETLPRYDQSRPFRAWALGVARLQVLKWRQARARDRLVLSEQVLESLAQTAEACADDLDRRRAPLKDCLGFLDGKLRDLVHLRYFENLAVAQIAERLGRTVAAIEMALVRLRKSLRQCVEGKIQRTESGI
jgi:RNA polymerase sigma-70 factor (ECF subfamily)